jgi:hypothetical protein
MFDARQVGMNKAQALAAKYNCRFITEWFVRGKFRHQRNDWLICLVDNHRTRLETLEVCDESGCQAVFAANETHSSEAYYYRRTWRGTHRFGQPDGGGSGRASICPLAYESATDGRRDRGDAALQVHGQPEQT